MFTLFPIVLCFMCFLSCYRIGLSCSRLLRLISTVDSCSQLNVGLSCSWLISSVEYCFVCFTLLQNVMECYMVFKLSGMFSGRCNLF